MIRPSEEYQVVILWRNTHPTLACNSGVWNFLGEKRKREAKKRKSFVGKGSAIKLAVKPREEGCTGCVSLFIC